MISFKKQVQQAWTERHKVGIYVWDLSLWNSTNGTVHKHACICNKFKKNGKINWIFNITILIMFCRILHQVRWSEIQNILIRSVVIWIINLNSKKN